jgi:DNA polymerase-1
VPQDRETVLSILEEFKPLFNDPSRTWIGQNIKYDLLVLKWYGIEILGNVFDTMLAHYVIDPDGKRSMDLLSAQYLGYIPVPIEDLIGKKGKGQGNMRDVALERNPSGKSSKKWKILW